MKEEIIKIIDKIRSNRCPTHKEIELLLKNREVSIPLLSEILKEVVRWKTVPEEIPDAPMHAVFLLGGLESKEGFDILSKILFKDRDFVDAFFGDILTECLPWALVRMAKDKPKGLYKIAKRNCLDTFVRNAAVKASIEQCFLYPERRKEFIKYFRILLKSAEKSPDPDWPDMLVGKIAYMAPIELRKEITELFDKNTIGPWSIDRDDMERAYQKPDLSSVTVDEDIFSIYDRYGWMIAWNDSVVGGKKMGDEEKLRFLINPAIKEPEIKPLNPIKPIIKGPKIGRNDPCPCGSGKKYKHCCGK